MQRNESYNKLCDKHMRHSDIVRHTLLAFLIGGSISFAGEIMANIFLSLNAEEKNAYLYVTLIFILLASISTSLGFFDKIAVIAGAGTLVPVTGFSNAVTSSAIDTRSEGYVSGVGTKIFTVAGPVILFAGISGTLYGFVYFLTNLFIK